MRTLWVSAAAGGPFVYQGTKPGQTALGLEKAHFDLHISPEEFDEVAAELARTLDYFHVPSPHIRARLLRARRPREALNSEIWFLPLNEAPFSIFPSYLLLHR
jgi:truncated hemoglobin YjbI